MKLPIARATGSVSTFGSGVVAAQNGNMMNGRGMWGGGFMGGYNGYWVPILLVTVVGVVGLVMWTILQKRE